MRRRSGKDNSGTRKRREAKRSVGKESTCSADDCRKLKRNVTGACVLYNENRNLCMELEVAAKMERRHDVCDKIIKYALEGNLHCKYATV